MINQGHQIQIYGGSTILELSTWDKNGRDHAGRVIFMAIFSRTNYEEMMIALSREQAKDLYDKLHSILSQNKKEIT